MTWAVQGVSVEAVDPVFQTEMLDMLKQVARPEMVVGWYHSHPGMRRGSCSQLVARPRSCPVPLTGGLRIQGSALG